MQTQFTEYLLTVDAAVYLKVSRKFLETARCKGDGPHFFKIGRSVRYRRGDLDEFMRAHRRVKTASGRLRRATDAVPSEPNASAATLVCASRKRVI